MRPSIRIGQVTAGSLIAAALLLPATVATADSFRLSYSDGHGHRHRHHGPRYHYGHYYYPPPVYYAPAPRVVYVPTPAPLVALPTSPPYRAPDGQYCREYQATVTINGTPQPSYGTACLQPDGAWRVVN